MSGKTELPNLVASNTQNGFVKDDAGNIYFGKVYSTEPSEGNSTAITVNGTTEYFVAPTLTNNMLSGEDATAVDNAVKNYLGIGTDNAATPAADVNVSNAYTSLKITGLEYGYYYVTTTTGSLVALTSTNPTGDVTDKNSVPTVDKTITSVDDGTEEKTSKGSVNTTSSDSTVKNKKAIAEAGSTVHFQSVITVGKGAANYVFKDKLDDTLALNTGNITVSYLPANATGETTATTLTAGTDYTLNATAGGEGTKAYTFRILFNMDSNAAKAALTEGAKITISYSATVKSDGLQTSNPAKNKAWVSYGNDPDTTHDTVPSETETYNAKVTLVKRSGSNEGTYLANAGFKLKKTDGNDAKYYKLTTTGEASNQTKSVSWVDATQGDELFSGPDGKLYTTKVVQGTGDNANKLYQSTDGKTASETEAVEASFTGLSNGTYYLEETTVPDGYNKAADTEVTISDADAEKAFEEANLNQSKTIVNQTGSLLPSTGGIGTTIFYVIGGVLIAGAAILLITRRKKA